MSLHVRGHIPEEPFHRNFLGRRRNCPGACWKQKQRGPFATTKRGSTMLCMRLSPPVLLAVTIIFVSVMIRPALSQTGPVSAVRISGRLVSPDGRPVSFSVQLSRSDDHRIEKTASAEEDGIFSFIVPAGQKYRISLGSGMKTASKVVDTASGKDI